MIGVPEGGPASRSPASRRSAGAVVPALLVGVALVGFLASDPGRVAADSRQYLYLDPGAFLRRAVSLWDPSVGAGTVPHQHLGFLWPMGPWFWLSDVVGLPAWVAQRLWLAGVAAAAGLGAHRLCRYLGASAVAALAAGLCYQLTPYQLAFTARFSVLLLPWAALPWLVLLARKAVAERTWRAPIWFGLVAATAGAVNASSLVLVLVAPAGVLLAAATRGHRRAAVAAGARIAAVTLGASAWWLAGLVVQGRYGLPVLQLTENVATVSAASAPDEIVRGLGNWIFAATDGAATVVEQAPAYRDRLALRAATVALPALALVAIVASRRRPRTTLVALLAVATVVGVGAWPVDDPSAYGELWVRFSESTSVGLALRNAPRIVPVIVLVVAVGLALGIDRFSGRRRTLAAAGVVVLVGVAIAPVARHGFLAGDFDRPEDVPGHWLALADDLDTGDDGSRVLEIPGANFAAYDWGNTVEPVLPGLVDRPTVAREVLPAGGAGTTDLLAALDRGFHHGTFDPVSLAPVARMLGAGDVVVRGDIDAARFGLPDPADLLHRLLNEPPPGFTVAGTYGGTDGAPVLLRLRLDDPVPRLRADPAAPVVLAGNGDGIVDATAAGLLDGRQTVLPAVTVDDAALDDAVARGGEVVVTDTNPKRATTFFYTITADAGATETADRREPDPVDYDVRFGPYAEADPAEQTVAVHLGGTVETSMGGGPEHPEDRAVHAFDGDPLTTWRPRAVPVGQTATVRLDEPVDLDEITLLDAPGPARVTSVALTVNGRRTEVALDDRARTAPGQKVPIEAVEIRTVTVEITGVAGEGIPGLAEIGLGEVVVDEVLRLPTRTVDRLGDRPAPVTYLLTREIGDLARTATGDEPVEADIDRLVTVASRTAFRLRGTAGAPGAGDDGSPGVAPDGPCDTTLVEIDGRGVPVRAESDGDGGFSLVGCEEIQLSAGEQRITTARSGPLRVDRLVLEGRSAADAGPGSAQADLVTTDDDERSLDGRVRTDGTPFWLVLAESRNDGWDLSVDGGTVSSAAMADGYANGWLVEPDGPGTIDVHLRWTPQRLVWAGMGISAVTVLAAGAALVVGRRRGRDDPPRWVEPAGWPDEVPGRASGAWSPAVSVVAALLFAATAWFVSTPAVAVVGLVALASRAWWGRGTLVLATAAGVCVLAAELTDRPLLVFVALALAGAELLGARSGSRAPETDDATANGP